MSRRIFLALAGLLLIAAGSALTDLRTAVAACLIAAGFVWVNDAHSKGE